MKPKRLKIIPVSLNLKLKIHNWLFKNEKQKLSVISVQAKKSLNDTNKIFCKIKVRESRHSDLSFVIDLCKIYVYNLIAHLIITHSRHLYVLSLRY